MFQNIFEGLFRGMSVWQVVQLLLPLIVMQLALFTVAVISLVRAERTRFLPIWGWGVIITFINIVGPILYLIFGRVKEEV